MSFIADEITSERDAAALRFLRFHWGVQEGGPYQITVRGGQWRAIFIGSSRWLTAGSPGELRELLWTDYFARLDAGRTLQTRSLDITDR